jgi:hypothetical protein
LFSDAGVSEAEAYGLYGLALSQAESMKDRFVIMDVLGKTDAFQELQKSGTSGERLKYGAAYYPNLETVLSYSFDDEDVKITSYKETNDAGFLVDVVIASEEQEYGMAENKEIRGI